MTPSKPRLKCIAPTETVKRLCPEDDVLGLRRAALFVIETHSCVVREADRRLGELSKRQAQ